MFPSAVRANRIAPTFGVCALLWLASGASAPVAQRVAAPQLAVGDHWQYRVTDNLRRGARSQLDVEVVEVTGRGARIHSILTGASGRSEWIDEVDGEGGLRVGSLYTESPRPFDPPAQLLEFPLDRGKTWRQVIDTLRQDNGLRDQILIFGRVRGTTTTTVPAGRFETVDVYRIVQLDDAEAWRSRTTRRESIWYAAAVKAAVRERREAAYTQRGGGRNPQVRTEATLLELVSFKPGVK